jgi:hypothetical protein
MDREIVERIVFDHFQKPGDHIVISESQPCDEAGIVNLDKWRVRVALRISDAAVDRIVRETPDEDAAKLRELCSGTWHYLVFVEHGAIVEVHLEPYIT